MKEITKTYSNGEVTIVWKPHVCIHSTICWKGAAGLSQVFNPAEKPWIKPEGATTARIVEQVKKCPSGALTYYMNADGHTREDISVETIAEVSPNGPLLVYGNIVVKEKDGHETHKNKVTAFCRCGGSGNKPYCDGTHTKIGFKDEA
ncbi:MAG: (4Fe-4S)-binding protein [Bacteroidetes bacterium]|nr:(4Fe-4S)-binding protein [Bacteroidota bacterium]